jgi:chromosomal replication initiation ATPase DnaA
MEQQVQKRTIVSRHAFWEIQTAFDSRFHRPGKTRDEEVISICDGIIDILSACFSIPSAELRSFDRANAAAARLRQVGMYIAHVAVHLSMSEVAKGFARDRTTVVHACHLVEDLRDDVDFDKICTTVEKIARAAFGVVSEG